MPADQCAVFMCFKNVFSLQINMAIARCIIPVYSLYIQGANTVKISIDGGKSYPFFTIMFISWFTINS